MALRHAKPLLRIRWNTAWREFADVSWLWGEGEPLQVMRGSALTRRNEPCMAPFRKTQDVRQDGRVRQWKQGDDHKTMTFLLREPEGGVSPPLPCGIGSLAQRGSGVAVSGRDAPRRRPWQGAGRVLRAESLLGSWRDPAVFP
jgi:hypothetical protein